MIDKQFNFHCKKVSRYGCFGSLAVLIEDTSLLSALGGNAVSGYL
jgi:hypothetical protein